MEVLICLLFVAYLIPFSVAARNDHERLGAILAANLLVGWTLVGWLAVLHWARHPAPPPEEPAVRLRRGHLRLLEPVAPADGARAPSAGLRRPRAIAVVRSGTVLRLEPAPNDRRAGPSPNAGRSS